MASDRVYYQKKKSKIVFICLVVLTSVLVYCLIVNSHYSAANASNDELHQGSIQEDSLMDVFGEMFNASHEQRLIDKYVLLKTMRFMVEERDEYDPEVIDLVQRLIIRPDANGRINLSNKTRTDFSQIGQSRYMDSLLKSKKNGFFVEAGAYDGESHSNTVFFELERAWTGILIEPLPSYFKSLLAKKRNAYVLNACLADRRPVVAKFRVGDVLSGRLSQMNDAHQNRMDKENPKKIFAYIPCFSLNTIMRALNVNKIDYFSLDVEGGEWDVIHGIDFEKIKIESFSIEYNGFRGPKDKITNYLLSLGYQKTKDDNQDIYFIKN